MRSPTTDLPTATSSAQRATGPALAFDIKPDGAREQEADRVADEVVGMRAAAFLTPPGGVTSHAPTAGNPAQAASGRPLDHAARAHFESRFGWDFSRVRIHTDGEAAARADRLDASAYTVGSTITFGAGQYAPGTPAGCRLLAHELTHVVQQGGASPLARGSGSPDRGFSGLGPAAPRIHVHGVPGIARDSKTPIPFPRVEYNTPTGTFYRRFDGITTYSSTSKETLAKAGYQFARTDGGHDVWVKTDRSSEIWLQVAKSTKSQAPEAGSGSSSPPPPKAPTNPDIEEAREWADDLEKRFNQLWKQAAELKAMRDPKGQYPVGPFNDYFKKLNRFDSDLKSVLDDEAPLWRDSQITAEEKKELEKQIARIKNVQEHPPELDLED
jgi:hypothetical protein